MKPFDETDFPLSTGAGFFADERDYVVFLKSVKPEKDVRVLLAAVGIPSHLMAGYDVLAVRSDGVLEVWWASYRNSWIDVRAAHVHAAMRVRRHDEWRSVSISPLISTNIC